MHEVGLNSFNKYPEMTNFASENGQWLAIIFNSAMLPSSLITKVNVVYTQAGSEIFKTTAYNSSSSS